MLDRNAYTKVVHRPYPLLFTSMVFNGFANKDNFAPLGLGDLTHKDLVLIDGDWQYVQAEIDRNASVCFKAWQNPTELKRVITWFRAKEQALIAAAEAGVDFATFNAAFAAYMPALALVYLLGDVVESAMREQLSKNMDSHAVDALMHQLNIPLEDNYYKKEEYNLARATDIPSHVQQYVWINSRYGEDIPYTIEQAQEKKSHIDREQFLTQFEQSHEQTKQAITKAKSVIDPEHHGLVDLMQFIIFYRTQRTDTMYRALYTYIPQFKIMAKALGLHYDQLTHFTRDELLSGQMPNKETLNTRMQAYALVLEYGKMRVVVETELEELRRFFNTHIDLSQGVRGKVANPGLVKGPVKLVRSRAEYANVTEGDILVTTMTTPNMVPIMKLAAGFVTDEGGITCHAAIISREMNKPCIIGTRVATQVLKDGDMVEVDANAGVVRKL